jgi:putative transcriptional regulator
MSRKKPSNPEDIPVLRRLRQEAGLTQSELAKLIPDKTRTKSLTQQAISRWESGEDEPELIIAQTKALCRVLGKSLEEIPDDLGTPKRSEFS